MKIHLLILIVLLALTSCIFDTDSQSPTAVITNPVNNSTISGITVIRVSASDNKAVTSVKFYIDGVLKSTDTGSPWEYSWNTSSYADEQQHTLLAKAFDEAGNEGTSSLVIVTVTSGMPTVSTSSVSNITTSTANCGGNVTSSGSATVTAKGVCWSTSSTPTILNSKTTDGGGTGSFTSEITGLNAGTRYYVRAYATNSKGTSYGSAVSFTTYIFNVISPNNETVWKQDDQDVEITWNTGNLGGNVSIDLYKGSDFVQNIIESTSNDGSYNEWDVPDDIEPGSDYQIKVSYDVNNYNISGYFIIKELRIEIIAPVGLAVWTRGEDVDVIWETGELGGNVVINLYRSQGIFEMGTLTQISSSTPNDGYYAWKVPSDIETGYYMLVIYCEGHQPGPYDLIAGDSIYFDFILRFTIN
jgi:hypothetical protein